MFKSKLTFVRAYICVLIYIIVARVAVQFRFPNNAHRRYLAAYYSHFIAYASSISQMKRQHSQTQDLLSFFKKSKPSKRNYDFVLNYELAIASDTHNYCVILDRFRVKFTIW